MAPYSLFFVASLLATAFCMPTPDNAPRGMPKHKPGKPGKPHGLSLEQLQEKQPLDGLPSNSNVTLKYVGLGVGVQNYSCTTGAPKSIGAVATLFDVTNFLEKTGDVSSDLSANYLKAYEKRQCTIDASNLGDDRCEESINRLRFPLLGKHYFASINGAGVPSFDIYPNNYHKSAFLSAAKYGDVPAPADAYDGANGLGAVDWLFLAQDGSGRSYGLSEVYRINTAGGVADPAQCTDDATEFSVKYAAEYWFYL